MELQIRLVGPARQFFRELERDKRKPLADAIKEAFGKSYPLVVGRGNHRLDVPVRMTPDGFRARLVPGGYAVIYRPMREFETSQFGVDRGIIIMDVISASDAEPF